MDAQELKRLKELAQAATPGPWDFDTAETPFRIAGGEVVCGDALPYGDVYTVQEYETPDGSECLNIATEIGRDNGRFIAAANPAAVLELIALAEKSAERAVSPTESVQSIDTPELSGIIEELLRAHQKNFQSDYDKWRADLVAYANTKIAAAHAEGRRSALEELAKEKERADKAEAKLKEWDRVVEVSMAADYANRAIKAEAALAARQAPDLSRAIRARIAHHEAKLADENDIHCGCSSTIVIELQALLSSTAQPLQQEGGKRWTAEEIAEACVKAGLGILECNSLIVTLTAAHPSDNLQQASTAQAELAKPEAACMNCNGRLGKDCAIHNPKVKEAASATDAVRYTATAADWPEDFAHENGNYENRCSECGIGFMGHKRRSVCKVCATPAQATPEGAPELQYPELGIEEALVDLRMAIDHEADDELVIRLAKTVTRLVATPEGADLPYQNSENESAAPAKVHQDVLGAAEHLVTAKKKSLEKAADGALMALAGSLEPVYQVREDYQGWDDVDAFEYGYLDDTAYEKRILYRAAPPQQVDTGGLPG